MYVCKKKPWQEEEVKLPINNISQSARQTRDRFRERTALRSSRGAFVANSGSPLLAWQCVRYLFKATLTRNKARRAAHPLGEADAQFPGTPIYLSFSKCVISPTTLSQRY